MNFCVLFGDNVEEIREYLRLHPESVNAIRYRHTPLMKAGIANRLDIIDCLIENNCDVNVQNYDGDTALHFECMKTNVNRHIIERLIAAGANGTIKDNIGYTPFHYLVEDVTDMNIIHLLIPISDPNAITHQGYTPLMLSCTNSKTIETINVLLDVTHTVNLQSTNGRTPLHLACSSNKNEAVKLLLEKGANRFICDNTGNTPYDCANTETKLVIDAYTK